MKNNGKKIAIISAVIVLFLLTFGIQKFYSGFTSEEESVHSLSFRNDDLLNEHYTKHGIDMGFDSAEAYEDRAEAVVLNPASLHKTEAEDGDDVYYLESTNEFVIVSTDGYIRTYFKPDAGIDYYNKQ